MRTLLLGLPLKRTEAILGRGGHFSADSRDRRAAPRKKDGGTLRVNASGQRKTARCREILTRFPIRNRKQTDTAGFVGAALCDARRFGYREKRSDGRRRLDGGG